MRHSSARLVPLRTSAFTAVLLKYFSRLRSGSLLLAVLLATLSPTLAQQGDAKIDPTKTDATKTDATKTDATKTDATKTDATKTDATKADTAKIASTKCSLDRLRVIGIEAKKANYDKNANTNSGGNNSNQVGNANANSNDGITNANASGPNKTLSESPLALYRTVLLEVENLPEWINQGCDVANLVLYVDGNAFPGLKPHPIDNGTKLQFDLLRDPNNELNKAAWTAVLSRRPKNWERDVPVTVGLNNGVQIGSDVKASLRIVDWYWFKIFVASFLIAIALFWLLARRSDIIRDAGPQPGVTNGKPKRKPYSLARTQMAFWFFIVIISYVFIWMVTSDASNLTTSVLVLIGISAATGLGAAMVDSTKTSNQEEKLRAAEETKKKNEVEAEILAGEIASLKTVVNSTPAPANLTEETAKLAVKQGERTAKLAEIEHATHEIGKLTLEQKTRPSQNFISDILSDDDGVSFHRFQIFAWTIVLILVFIGSVYNSLAMPNFDPTLLTLMGISGGTYLGFKLPNKEG